MAIDLKTDMSIPLKQVWIDFKTDMSIPLKQVAIDLKTDMSAALKQSRQRIPAAAGDGVAN